MSDSTPTVPFDVGDYVRVKEGIKDTDYPDSEIGGWQGRVVEITDQEPSLLLVEWDSVTLEEMPIEILKEAELEGLSWERYYLDPRDVEAAEPRDAPQDVKQVRKRLYDQLQWSHADEQEEQIIRQVLEQVDNETERATLQAWKDALTNCLHFPFEATVAEPQDGGSFHTGDTVKVKNILLLDSLYGLLAVLQHGRSPKHIPLADLEATDEDSGNYRPLRAYCTWFANR
jgi:hypothetical protein